MFVSKQKYQKLKIDRNRLSFDKDLAEHHLSELERESNKVMKENSKLHIANVKLIERNDILLQRVADLLNESMNSSQFTQDEIRKLISLCHPDKHAGKATATEMTAKLNKMKG